MQIGAATMSIDTLLEAAKFVEWSDQIGYGARGNNVPEVLSFSQNGQSGAVRGISAAAIPSSPSSSPGSHKSSSPGAAHSKHHLSTSNTDTLDEADDKRSGTREVHNKLEKNRRAHLKECFDNLREQIPNMDDKKMKPSNLSILQGALRYLQALKRKERELEYETERLARQKIKFQERLAKLSGCPLPPWKKDEVGAKEEEGPVEEEENEDDRDSVSTSTSTASEAEEEERKSRAQSPEVKSGQALKTTDVAGIPTIRTDQSTDHVIKVTQSVKEQSGPYVINRRIVAHVPISTAPVQQQQTATHVPVVVKQQQQQGSNHRKIMTQPQTTTRAPGQPQQWVVGTKRPLASAKEIPPQQVPGMTQVVTQRVAATQKVIIRPQVATPPPGKMQQVTSLKPGASKQSTTVKQVTVQQTSGPGQVIAQPKVTTHVVRQLDTHSSAVSAVQEHLKNKAQNKLPQQQQQQQQQQKQPSRTVHHATPATETVITSQVNVTVVSTSAVTTATTSAGVSRQTVSQLLGKQSVVIRQPVRRTDNKYVVQRVVRHPFSPRPQTVDIMPKSPTVLTSNDAAKTLTSFSAAAPITVVTYKEPQPSPAASSASSSTPVTGSTVTLSVNTPGIPTCSAAVQQVTSPPGLDMRNLISHGVMLPPIPHYLPPAGLATTMLRPSLTNPSVLTAANAALLSQAMIASNTRNVNPQLTIPVTKEGSQTKLHSPASASLSFFSPAVTQQATATNISQPKPSSLYTAPITPGHPFLTPGLALQPALTQVLFTQPPIAAYTVANSSIAHTLVKPAPPSQSVIRHPTVTTTGAGIQQVVTTTATEAGTSSSISVTTAAVTVPPVVTIGAVSFNPLLGTNRALVTAPTYSTLSFGQYPHYRFPFTGQVPIISPVTFTGNPSGAAVPVTSVGNQTVTNARTSNGVIVHTVAIPTAIPVTSTLPNPTTISNGVSAKEATLPIPAQTSAQTTSVTTALTQPAVTHSISRSQEGGDSNSQITSGSSVSATTSS